MTWPRWHWLNDGLIPLLVITLRVCWLWPWLELLRYWLASTAPRPLVPLWAIFGLFLLSNSTTRLALTRTASLRQARAWVSAAGLAAVLALLWWQYAAAQYPLWELRWLRLLAHALSDWRYEVPPAFLTLLAATVIWLRGVVDGQRPMLRDAVWGAFTTGALALALLLLAGHYTPAGLPAHTERWVLAFFIVGLAALALSSLQLARAVGRWGSQKPSQVRLNRYWLLSVAVVILLMMGVGLLLGALITPGAVAQALSWVGVVLGWLATIVGYLFLAVTYVLFLVLTPLIEWIRGQMMARPPAREEPIGMMDWQERLRKLSQQPGTPIPPEAIESLRWLWLLALLIAIGVAIAIALRLMQFSDSEGEDETRESVFSGALLQEQLAALWQGWMRRLRRPAQAEPDPYLSLAGEEANRRAIRGLYQTLLNLAGARGLARTPPQTPLDYARTLAAEFPTDAQDWQTLTEAYMGARYAAQPPTPDQVEQARQAWSRLSPYLAPTETPLDEARAPSARRADDRKNASDGTKQTDTPGTAGRRGQDDR